MILALFRGNIVKKLLVKIPKAAGILFAFIAVCTASYFGYEYIQKENRKREELSFATTYKWKWHNEYEKVQIRFDDESKKSVLRKVNLKNKYAIYAIKDEKYRLTTIVQFQTACKDGSKIATTKKFASGNVKTLYCQDGKYLVFSAYWPEGATDLLWQEELDGFSFRENLSYWDMSKLDQEITLQKAK